MKYFTLFFVLVLFSYAIAAQQNMLSDLQSPVIFKGDEKTAFRDPAVFYHDNKIYLFFTCIKSEDDGKVYSYTSMSTSKNLVT